jgi:hypothetical protein
VAWDTLVVAGVPLPGAARISSGGRQYETDKKKVVGADGQTLTGLGHVPAQLDIALTIWTGRQFQAMSALIPTLLPLPGKGTPQPLAVYHPSLVELGIRSLYFTFIGVLIHMGKGKFERHLRATEFLPTKPANVTATPTASQTANPNGFAVPTRPSVLPVPSAQQAAANPPSTDLSVVGPGVGGFSGATGFTGFSG